MILNSKVLWILGVFQWNFGTLCKETGLLTFLIYICLIFRRSLWKQDYSSSSNFNIQMEKIVVKLGANLVPTVLWEGCNTACFSQWELFLLPCPWQEHPTTTPLMHLWNTQACIPLCASPLLLHLHAFLFKNWSSRKLSVVY